MTNRQDNKLSMYLAVQQICQSNATQWNTLPAANRAFTEFEQCILHIQDGSRRQVQQLTGVTTDKMIARRQMTDKVYVLAQAIVSYARINNNTALAQLVDYSYSGWMQFRSNLAKEKTQQVLQVLETLAPQLLDYGLSTRDVDELKALLDTYQAKITAPRTVINQRREATMHIQSCFDKSEELLHTLDRLFLQRKNTPFYNTYASARKLVNLRGGLRKRKSSEVVAAALN